ncbi:MAG: sigma-70 family RNA polymerase sigma factor [Planctomycetia bacterium]|nr:sigma-70 family RNA polymerase sigma factor [Planctomycetia bacterium]
MLDAVTMTPPPEDATDPDAGPQHEPLSPGDLVRAHQADVWRYLRYLGCDATEAEDLTQETFLAVLRTAFEQRSAGETAAYLRRVARNQLLMLRRREGREPAMIELSAAEDVWASTVIEGRLDPHLAALEDCLRTAITPRVREAVAMHYTDKLSRDAIAAALKMTADGVKTMLRRARAALAECIERKLRTEP